MNKIKEWLTDNGIEFEEQENPRYKGETRLIVSLERNCETEYCGKPVTFDKKITIAHITGGMYLVDERKGYADFKYLSQSLSTEKTINRLKERLC